MWVDLVGSARDLVHPGRADDLPAVPPSVLQEQVAEAGAVSCTEVQIARRLGFAVEEAETGMFDPDGVEQVLTQELRRFHSTDLSDNGAQTVVRVAVVFIFCARHVKERLLKNPRQPVVIFFQVRRRLAAETRNHIYEMENSDRLAARWSFSTHF